jgi:hypothetical protein
MEFFNRKQEVMDIQMTQYGKHLLSKGLFKPEYYSFFDDDIIYDSEYANMDENQNDIEGRIKETPRQKTQYVFSGIETNIKEINEAVLVKQESALGAKKIQPAAESNYSLPMSLGNSSLESEELPAWSITYLGDSSLLTASNHLEVYGNKLDSSNNPVIENIIPIPQLNSDFLYESEIFVYPGIDEDSPGTIEVIEEKIPEFVIEIGENNTDFLKDNFDLQIFKIQDNFTLDGEKTGEETLIPLYFSDQKHAAHDYEETIMLGEEDDILDLQEYDSTYVDHYFHVLLDKEIDPDTLCSVKPVEKSHGIFSDRVEICAPSGGRLSFDIYDDLPEDPGEPC